MNKSYLMVAGDKQKHLDKLPVLKCDVAMINLEDGVYNKKFARELLTRNFSESLLRFHNLKTVVRVNSLDKCAKEDIECINKLKPNAIRVPKIQNVGDVEQALSLIDKDIDIHLSIETKDALDNLTKLKIDKRVTTAYLGILDMCASLGLEQSAITLDNPTIEYILSKFLIDSKIAGLYPVSFVYQEYKNTTEFRKWCNKVKAMGYTASSTISPAQVDIANEVFDVTQEKIAKAKYIKETFERQQAKSCTGFVDEKYGFIDEPIYKDALLVLKNR